MSPSSSRKRILEIVTSGKSGRSLPSTSPMLMKACPPLVCGSATSAHLSCCRAGEEHQPVLADLHLVAPGEHGALDALAVEVGAVEASHVAHREPVALPDELGVPTRHRDVVQEDVAVGVPARGRQVGVEK